MRIIVFGATGGTGIAFVEQSLAAGHIVTAVARNVSNISLKHERLRVVQGDVLVADSLATMIADHDAVVFTVGATHRGPTSLFSVGITNTLAAMQDVGVRRLIIVSASGITPVPLSLGVIWLYNTIVGPMIFGNLYADMRRMETIILSSNVDWTIIRPARLLNAEPRGAFRLSIDNPQRGMLAIARADLAAFMLTCLDEETYIQQSVVIAY